MKHKILIIFPLNILFFISYCFGSIIISKENPSRGDEIRVRYIGPLAEENTKLYCIFYYSDLNSKVKTLGVEMVLNEINTSLIIPDSAVYFTFFAVNRSKIDNNNGQGFGFHVYQNSKPIKYSYLSKGYFNKFNNYIFKGEVNNVKAAKYIEKEWELYPEMKKECLPYYLELLLQIPERKKEALEVLKEKMDYGIVNRVPERDIRKFSDLYYSNNRIGLDSIKNILINLYPKGITYSETQISKIDEDNILTIEEINQVLYGDYVLTINQKFNLLKLKLLLLLFQNNSDEYEETLIYAKKELGISTFYEPLGGNFNEYANNYLKGKRFELAHRFSKQSLRFYSYSDTLSVFYGNILDTYASALYGIGDLNGAINYQRKAVELMNLQDQNANQRFIEYLYSDKNYSEIIEKGKEIIASNTSTLVLDSLYSFALKSLNKTDPNYEFLKEANLQKDKQDILAELINQKASNFALKDLNGETVQLKDFSGKILIIDFWATWCKPCLASFPAMKKAQKELENTNVKFVFINTFENQIDSDNSALTEKIIQLSKKKNFTEFDILLDKEDPKIGSYQTSTDYNVKEIPVKFIIDQGGNLRYKSIGFGSEEKLLLELKTVVNFLLNENQPIINDNE